MAREEKVNAATVRLWGQDVGVVAWNSERDAGDFVYTPGFIRRGLQIAPLTMPLSSRVFTFPELNRTTFHGLPGLLADALPDRFGNRLIDLWLAKNGRSPSDFTPVERLCYMSTRGMGALEFKPARGPQPRNAETVEVAELVALASEVLSHQSQWAVHLKGDREAALNTIIRVGTSAGGNRAKAVISWNPKTNEVRSGQVKAPEGFESWILKFDGVHDTALGDPKGFGRVEFVYHEMAVAAGIEMSACRLFEENGRAHFMTRRFDRDNQGGKIHVQSLCAMAHYDFNASGEYGYEQALSVIQRLNLGYPAMQEMYRRMVFNVVARNQDDHTRNIAFLMDPNGVWRLAPAFDVVWAYNPKGGWTNRHQLSVNGKRDAFERADLLAVAGQYGIKKAAAVIEEVIEAVSKWSKLANEFQVPADLKDQIARTHRLDL